MLIRTAEQEEATDLAKHCMPAGGKRMWLEFSEASHSRKTPRDQLTWDMLRHPL